MTVLVGRRESFNALPGGLLRSVRARETGKNRAEVGDRA
jgi:hypothetical protein